MPAKLPPGKLPHDFLEEVLNRYTTSDDSVVEGAGSGIDATLLRTEDRLLFAKTDPVTFVTGDLGHYIVNINANDLAAMGGEPKWFLVTLLFPVNTTNRGEVETVFSEIREACDELSVLFCGGHTEVSDAVNRPIAIGMMLGRPMTRQTFQASLAQPGDAIVLTKGAAIEGTSIIAREKRHEVFEDWGWEFLAKCLDYLKDPGISVLPEARIAIRVPGVHAMHDPTEGGVCTALHELADASGTGILVDGDSILILPETRKLCGKYGIDPLGLIASGALLIAVEGENKEELVSSLLSAGIDAEVIGRLLKDRRRRKIVMGGMETDLKRYDKDEVLKI